MADKVIGVKYTYEMSNVIPSPPGYLVQEIWTDKGEETSSYHNVIGWAHIKYKRVITLDDRPAMVTDTDGIEPLYYDGSNSLSWPSMMISGAIESAEQLPHPLTIFTHGPEVR